MTGHDTFNQMVTATTTTRVRFLNHIPQEDFEIWQKDVIWDCLHGIRYGQSFCNRFGIDDNLVYYSTWPAEQMEEYIRKHYIARS
jgi:hypothetical protein